MTDRLSDLSKQALKDIRNSSTLEELDSVRVQYLGKKGSVSSQLKKLSKVDQDDRPSVGKEVNKLKQLVENAIAKLSPTCAVYDVTGENDAIIISKFKSREEMSDFTKKLLSMSNVERTNSKLVLNTVKEDFRLAP